MLSFLKSLKTPSRAQDAASSPESDQSQTARVTTPAADPSEPKRQCTPTTGSRRCLWRSVTVQGRRKFRSTRGFNTQHGHRYACFADLKVSYGIKFPNLSWSICASGSLARLAVVCSFLQPFMTPRTSVRTDAHSVLWSLWIHLGPTTAVCGL
jgi:hypothetical protein